MALDEALTEFAGAVSQAGSSGGTAFLGGLEVQELAEALKISPGTVKRDLRFAKVGRCAP
jgi:hypothetical protein